MRIGVRAKCQRQGIGRKLMSYLLNKYPNYLSLDVSTDNVKAVQFYSRIGLQIVETYITDDKVEFNKFDTPKGYVYKESIYNQIIEEKKQAKESTNNSDDDET